MDTKSKLQIDSRQLEDVTLVALTGRITLDDGEVAFGEYIDALLRQGRRKILLDLGGVTYIDSAGVGRMAAQIRVARGMGATMKLVNLRGRCQRVLAALNMTAVFEIFEDEAAAIQSFGA